MRRIKLELILTGEDEESYSDTVDDLVVEDFIWQHLPEGTRVDLIIEATADSNNQNKRIEDGK